MAGTLAAAIGERGDAVGLEGRRLFERELAWSVIAERFARLLAQLPAPASLAATQR